MSAISDKAHRSSRRARRGATMLEATFTFMLFLAFVFSIFDFGYVLWFHHTLMHRARTAARYGVVNPFPSGCATTDCAEKVAIKNLVLFDSVDAPNGQATGIFSLTAADIDVVRTSAGTHEDRLMVTVRNYRYPLITFLAPGMHRGRPISAALSMEEP